jgi:CheY-like chemotaxis protein
MQKIALLVDDSRVARITLKRLLVANELNVIEFENAQDAIQYLEQAQQLPDIIFMDVMMPGMDGVTATDVIKRNPKTSQIPIVMCTGNETANDMQHGLSTGAMAILSKPPVEGELQHILSDLENIPTAEPDVETPQAGGIDQQALIEQVSEAVTSSLQADIQNRLALFAQQIEGGLDKQAVEQLISQCLTRELELALSKLERDVATSVDDKLIALADAIGKQSVEQSLQEKSEFNSKLKSVESIVTQEFRTQISEINLISEDQVQQIVEQSVLALELETKFAELNAKLRKQNRLIVVIGLVSITALVGSLLF